MNIEEFNNNINHILDEGKIENIPIPNADIIKSIMGKSYLRRCSGFSNCNKPQKKRRRLIYLESETNHDRVRSLRKRKNQCSGQSCSPLQTRISGKKYFRGGCGHCQSVFPDCRRQRYSD